LPRHLLERIHVPARRADTESGDHALGAVALADRPRLAAQAKYQAGMPHASLQLLALADASPRGEFQRAQADLLRGRMAFTVNRGRDTPALLLKAAAELEPLDVRLAPGHLPGRAARGLVRRHLATGTDAPGAEFHLLDGGHFLPESQLDDAAGRIRGFLGRTLS
jgi:hypothetical protein